MSLSWERPQISWKTSLGRGISGHLCYLLPPQTIIHHWMNIIWIFFNKKIGYKFLNLKTLQMLNFYNNNKSFSHDLKNENIALFLNLSQQCCGEQTNLGVSQGYKRLQRKAEPPVPHVTAFLSPPSLTVKASVTNQSPPTYSNLRVTSPCDCYIFSLKYFPKRNTESYRSSLIFPH